MLTKVETHVPDGVLVGKEKLTLYNVIIIFTLSVGGFSGAMPNGIISTTLGQPSFLEYFHLVTATGLDDAHFTAITAVFFTGAVLGTFTQSFTIDRWGRKKALQVAAVGSIVGAALLAGSVNIAMFIVCRFIAGFFSACFVMAVPLYMSELVPPHSRGLMVGLFGISLSCGYSLASWLGVAFYFCKSPAVQWRMPLGLTAVPSILFLALLPFVPESPRWLMIKNRGDEAAQIVQKLHGGNLDPRLAHFADLEIEQMKQQIEFERQNSVSWIEFLTDRKYARRVWSAAFAFITAQSTGILTIVTYSAVVSASVGYGPVEQLCFSAGYLSTGILAAIIGGFIVDRVGRVRLMVIGTFLLIMWITIFTALFATYAGGSNKAANQACIAIIFLYFLTYGICMEGTIYTYVSELFPSHLRAKGVAWAILVLYLTNIPYITALVYAITTIGWRYYLVFITVPLASVIVLILLAKETKGKSLEEIGALFGDELVVKALDDQIEDERRGVPTVEGMHEEDLKEAAIHLEGV